MDKCYVEEQGILQDDKDAIIEHLVAMANNTRKQAIDGTLEMIREGLKADVKDAQADYSNLPIEEQAEIYKTLLGDIVETLRHFKIA